ncbi:MAG: HD domain-containing protein [Tenericutes bacterium]|nr:HD domain-containing protein [Mycoplasmatota bacterium]
MNDRYDSAIKFYLLATKLKYKLRSGWDSSHWNINSDRLESIAEHVYGTLILAISLDSALVLENELESQINFDKVLKMLVIHEIGEVLIGDITPFDNITPLEKKEMEHKAVIEVVGDLFKKEELISIMFEFDERKTPEAKFAYYCDKMEADIQAKVYQDNGLQRPLSDQENNVVFNNSKVQKMVESGASTAFDIWYEWDKHIFEENNMFKTLHKRIKEKDTNMI